jgi:imidazolonepropionase-like amidohydrolase
MKTRLALLLLTLIPLSAAPLRIEGADAIALTGATVIDGSGAAPKRNAVVAIVKDRIAYVGGRAGVRFGRDVKKLDLKGRWVIPGFVDTHVHLPGGNAAAPFLAQLAAFGTTTVRDTASALTALRDRIARGEVVGPRLLAAGALIDGKDPFFGFAVRATTEAEVRAIVRRQAAQKVDFIKLYVGLPPAVVRAAIEEAHGLGLPVMGHLGQTTWTEAAQAGIDSLAHSWYAGLAHSIAPPQRQAEFREFYIPNRRFSPALFAKWREAVNPRGPEAEALAKLLAERRVEVHPNLVLGEAVTWGDDPAVLERLEPDFAGARTAAQWRGSRHQYSSSWPPEAMAEAKRCFPMMVQAIELFHERGVLLTAGTDYQNPWMTPGVAYHRELELLAGAGIPPLEVLRIATRNGAQGLGILAETGTIEAGKRADLVVLTADPLVAISNTRKIERVFLRGRSFTPTELLPDRRQIQ